MDLKKCKILLDAIDYRNLSKVAKDYGYTPSGIWHMIAAIENELGFPLFISSTSGVIPTDNCLRLARAPRAAQMQRAARAYDGGNSRR